MTRYLDPKADVVFKKIFGEHPHLLKSFLNAVLPLPEDGQIVELVYLSNEQTPKIPALKRTIADVRCTDQQGRVFIVEMQIEWTDSFKQRLLLESGQALVKQLKDGEHYKLLKPVYGLGLIAAKFDPTNCWYHHYQLVNLDRSPREVIEHLQLVFIELPKFPVHSPQEKKLRLLWLRFMREINRSTTIAPEEFNAVPEIKEALHLAEEAAYTDGELESYERYLDAVRTEKTLLIGRYEEGLAKGIEQGITQGITQGIEQGVKTGEQQARESVALKMLASGLPLAVISECTRLPLAEIQKLQVES